MKILWTDKKGWHELESWASSILEAKAELKIVQPKGWQNAWFITSRIDDSIVIEEIPDD